MKVQIRQGVFETNSSSTHSISICSKAEWDAFEHGKLYYNMEEDKFLPVDEAAQKNIEICKYYEGKGWDLEDYEDELWLDFESYTNYIYRRYEEFCEIKTVGGVEVVAFGYYGTDY